MLIFQVDDQQPHVTVQHKGPQLKKGVSAISAVHHFECHILI